MGEPPPGKRHQSLTLAFGFSALEELADPSAVFADARQWSRYLAVVGNDPAAIEEYLREHDLEQDVALGDEDKWQALAGIRQATDTERHVFVGTTGDDRRAAEHTGWEYLPLAEAAEKAEWEVARRRDRGPFGRFREWLPVG